MLIRLKIFILFCLSFSFLFPIYAHEVADRLLPNVPGVFKKSPEEQGKDYRRLVREAVKHFDNRDYRLANAKASEASLIALRIFEQDDPQFADISSILGSTMLEVGEYEEAIDLSSQAERILKQAGQTRTLEYETVLRNLGVIYTATGDFRHAKENLNKALEVCETLKDKGGLERARIYNNLGQISFLQLDYIKAKDFYLKAIDVRTEKGMQNPATLANIYANIGDVFRAQHYSLASQEKLTESVEALNRAEEYYGIALAHHLVYESKKKEYHKNIVSVLMILGQINIGLENFDLGKQRLDLAQTIIRQLKSQEKIREVSLMFHRNGSSSNGMFNNADPRYVGVITVLFVNAYFKYSLIEKFNLEGVRTATHALLMSREGSRHSDSARTIMFPIYELLLKMHVERSMHDQAEEVLQEFARYGEIANKGNPLERARFYSKLAWVVSEGVFENVKEVKGIDLFAFAEKYYYSSMSLYLNKAINRNPSYYQEYADALIRAALFFNKILKNKKNKTALTYIDAALDFYDKIEEGKPVKHISEKQAARVLVTRAKIYKDRGENKEAIQDLERALKMSTELGERAYEAQIRYNMALNLFDFDKFEPALDSAKSSVALLQEDEHPQLRDQANDLIKRIEGMKWYSKARVIIKGKYRKACDVFANVGFGAPKK